MFKNAVQLIIVGALALPLAARAEPIKLKLSFFSSDRSSIYQFSIKPFVDIVNEEGQGLIDIEVYFSGAISKLNTEQAQLVADGTADMAIVVPGYQPEQFPDTAVMELPGVFQNAMQASRIYTQLVAMNALAGYKDSLVLGAFVSEGESINSRKPITSLADLKGQRIRTNNEIEIATLRKLGAIPVVLPINQTTDAISQGKIDGAAVPPAMLPEFGIGRVTDYHYMIRLGGAPTALVMNRKKFESLPPQAQAIIRKYSGEWLSERSASAFDTANREILRQFEADPRRKVVFPSQADHQHAQAVFDSVAGDWAARSLHNRELLAIVRSEIAKPGSSN
jgi:TRAP-type C4-dicarboxylate transport system substrate-binding protein